MPLQRLKILGQFDLECAIEFAELERDYGDGYDSTVRVGHSEGLKTYRLVYKALPQTQGQSILDDETMTQKKQADYLWDFFVKRKQDGEAFIIKDPRTETDIDVKFAERRLSYQMFALKLYSTGIALREWRS